MRQTLKLWPLSMCPFIKYVHTYNAKLAIFSLKNNPSVCGRVEVITISAKKKRKLFVFLNNALFDTGFLTCEVTQIIKFCATHFTVFHNSDRLDEG